MKNINIGIANLIISNKLKESYLNNDLINESKLIVSDFLDLMKNSPILQLEFKVFNSIEGKNIDDDMFAKQYIDNNIKLFEIYTLEEVKREHSKLSTFLKKNIINESNVLNNESIKYNLYNSINTLILESLKIADDVNVDNIHEAFTLVFNYIKNPKNTSTNNIITEEINDNVIEIAVEKFNDRYNSLDEDDKDLLKKLIKLNNRDKKNILESYKSDILLILEKFNKSDDIDNKISKAINKINEMVYDENNINENIIDLHEFKKELL
jgi:hypothetical protein